MAAAIPRMVPLALWVTTWAVLVGPAAAQSRDPLPEVRARLKIEAQRVEKETRDGRMRAYRLLRDDPQDAIDILKGLIGTLRKDTVLSEERRKTLLTALQRDITNVRALAGVRRTTAPSVAAARTEARPAPNPRVREGARSAYDTASKLIQQRKGAVAEARNFRARRGDRLTGTLAQIDKSAMAPKSDYDLPDDWLEKSKRRSPQRKLTAEEKAILEALKKPIKVDYDMETLQSVIDDLSKKMGQDILLNKLALEEANITYDTPITLRFNKPVSARTALKRVLADVGLTYVIREETIEVTSLARARDMMTVRAYYVGDLLGVVNPLLPAVANQFQMIQAIGSIINQIQSIEPDSWEGRGEGGLGTITFDPARMALIIKQSAEIHYMIDGLR